MNEMTDKMRVHYLSTNALNNITNMLKEKDKIIVAQAEHIEALQVTIESLGGTIFDVLGASEE
tara:strand:+ start:657 stop:845 length:189 start_codon:yes stop_codon:yes gene_type:complete